MGDFASALFASWWREGRRVLLTAHFSRAGDWGRREIFAAHFSRSGGGGGEGGDLCSALFTTRSWQHTFPELAGGAGRGSWQRTFHELTEVGAPLRGFPAQAQATRILRFRLRFCCLNDFHCFQCNQRADTPCCRDWVERRLGFRCQSDS